MSGLNGVFFYFAVGLFLTSIISLYMLKFNRNLTDNGFQNIILSNSFLALIMLYIYITGL